MEPAKRTPEQKAELTRYYRGQDAELLRLAQAVSDFGKPADKRLLGAQDVAWALINSPGVPCSTIERRPVEGRSRTPAR